MLVLELQAKEDCNSWRDTVLLVSFIAVFWFLLPARSSCKDVSEAQFISSVKHETDIADNKNITTDDFMWLHCHL